MSLDPLVNEAFQAHLDSAASLVLLVSLDWMAHLGNEAQQDHKDNQDQEGNQDLLDHLGSVVVLDLLVSAVQLDNLVNLDLLVGKTYCKTAASRTTAAKYACFDLYNILT